MAGETDTPSVFDERTAKYVKLRDMMDALKEKHKAELAPLENAKKLLEQWFLDQLNELGVSSIKGPHGTVYKRTDVSCTIADGAAFRAYIEEHDAWDLVDLRANKTAVREFVESNDVTPPGVNYSTSFAVGCRRGKE